jgi:perosamine synthetase
MTIDKKNIDYDNYIKRISKESIPAYEPIFNSNEIELLGDVIDSGWVSEGKYCRKFEDYFKQLFRVKYSSVMQSATAALMCGMRSMGIAKGDDVIVPSLGHSADANAVFNIGANAVFADVDHETLCLSVESIQSVITSNTKAVIFICAYGNYGQLAEVTKFCRENNLFLINDSAPALVSKINNKYCASYGDFSVLSFFADKTITTGEGGMFLTDDSEIIKKVNILKHDGRPERGHDVILDTGFNFRFTELQAALGVAQLNKINEFVDKKLENYFYFKNEISKINNIELFSIDDGAIPHRYIVFCDSSDKLINGLVKKGIGARSLFMPLHTQKVYKQKFGLSYDEKNFSVTNKLYKKGVCLPSAPSLKKSDIEYICQSLRELS